eukprot:gene20793-biopygen14651
MGPQPHTYGRGRFFRGRARGPFFAAGRYNGPGGPLLQPQGPCNAYASPWFSPTPPTGPPYRKRARATGRGRIARPGGLVGSSPPGVGHPLAP